MKKVILNIFAGLVLMFSLATFAPVPSAFAENGAPTYYRVMETVNYRKGDAFNSAEVVMNKQHGTEYYDMIFYKDFFVVTRASCFENAAVHKNLQNEVGIRQKYIDNPKTTAVKNDMLRRGFLHFE